MQACKLFFLLQMLGSALLHVALSPDGRSEKHNNRENFQSAQKHIHAKHQLCKAGEEGKVLHRPCHSKPRADITQAGRNCGYIRNKVEIIQRNQHERPQQNKRIQNNKPHHATNRILIHLTAVQFNQVDRARVHNMADLPPNHFQKDYKTRNLNTACG